MYGKAHLLRRGLATTLPGGRLRRCDAGAFRAPGSGPSLTFANGRASRTHRTGKHGYVRVAVRANGTAGSYKVVAGLHSTPVRTATFSLTNTP